MALNRHRPHLLVLPEDDATRSLANGFVDASTGPIQVLVPVRGWPHVLAEFQRTYVEHLRKYSQGHLVLLIDFDDDFPFWESLPAAQVCSVQDPITGIEYRAVRNGRSEIACKLVERAADARVAWEQDESNDFQRERMRQWFERLEFARDLMRIYNP